MYHDVVKEVERCKHASLLEGLLNPFIDSILNFSWVMKLFKELIAWFLLYLKESAVISWSDSVVYLLHHIFVQQNLYQSWSQPADFSSSFALDWLIATVDYRGLAKEAQDIIHVWSNSSHVLSHLSQSSPTGNFCNCVDRGGNRG